MQLNISKPTKQMIRLKKIPATGKKKIAEDHKGNASLKGGERNLSLLKLTH